MFRVLHVIANVAPRYGGPSRAVQDMCHTLAARGHYVELFTTNQDGRGVLSVPVNSPVQSDGYVTTFFGVGGPHAYPISRGLYGALERRMTDFDVIEIHGLYLFHTFVGAALARHKHIPYVIQPHGTLNRYQRAHHRRRKALYGILAERRNLNGAAAIHYTTDQERQEAEETGIRAPGLVVPLGIDVDLYGRPAHDIDLPRGIPRGVPLITFLGRLAEKKGLDITVDAFAQVIRMGVKAHLVIAGPDNDGLRNGLERQVTACGLAGYVTFTGIVTGAPKLALLQWSRAFVLPSHDENFGISVVEALAASVPVIISRGVAIHPDVDAAGAGIVVDRTSEAVADAILKLLSDETARQQMAAAARILAVRRFSLDAMGESLERMYVLATHKHAAPMARGAVS
jgi:glycosyltransferase involved in cell wall biosynthesis